jgi:tripartite-type tricarboxylate transporter receptor subunit TctC
MNRRSLLWAGLFAFATAARAQTFPTKPITFVVPYPAGGTSDFTARTLGPELSKQLGQPVVIENIGGGGGVVGMQKAAGAPPDGHTIYFGGTELVVPPMVNDKLKYDWKARFTPVAQFAAVWFVLAAPAKAPFSNFREFIDYARKNPGKVSYASPGIATTQHMLGESIKERAKVDIVHVPYKGGAQINTDLQGGHIDAGFLTVASMLSNKGSGIKAVAVTSPKRAPQLPDIQSFTEVKELADFSMGTWQGLFVPVGTPAPVVAKLAAALQATMKSPEVVKKLEEAGSVVTFSDATTFTKFIDSETGRYRRIVDFAKMKVTE